MTTSDRKTLKLLETYSQKATDAKPVGMYTKKELIKLEHEWRLKLKANGFSDIEMWDNKPRVKKKRVKFIKGHIRMRRYEKYKGHVTTELCAHSYDKSRVTSEILKFWKGFELNAQDTFNYFRVIGLYAHHAPYQVHLEKYRELLKYYALHGVRTESIEAIIPGVKTSAVDMYMFRNFPKMLEFVNKMDNEEDE